MLRQGCWDPNSHNLNVEPGNRYFAKVNNAEKYSATWTPALGVHLKSDLQRAMLPPNIEVMNFSLGVKYYPGEGMAVTSNMSSIDRYIGAAGFYSGMNRNGNVRYAELLLAHAPKCPR